MLVDNFSISGNDIEAYAILEKPVDSNTIKGDTFFYKEFIIFRCTV